MADMLLVRCRRLSLKICVFSVVENLILFFDLITSDIDAFTKFDTVPDIQCLILCFLGWYTQGS